jgi:hypothetical protein
MTDAPERTLSERIREVHPASITDVDALADEVAALEQENRALRVRTSPQAEPCTCPGFCLWHERKTRERFAALEQERTKLRTALVDAFKAGTQAGWQEVQRLREAIREETVPYVNDSGPIGGLASRLRALAEGKNE